MRKDASQVPTQNAAVRIMVVASHNIQPSAEVRALNLVQTVACDT